MKSPNNKGLLRGVPGEPEQYAFPTWSKASVLGGLILCAVLPYSNALLNGFVYDDDTQILNNPYIRSFHYLRQIFGTTVWSYLGLSGGTNYYRPMMTLGYLICYELFGLVAYGFHLVSVLLHAGVVCLLFLVTERMFENRFLALVAAGLFALHPVHTESVAWIGAVTDLELTFFYLLTFWLFLSSVQGGGARSVFAELGMAGSFVLTILSKEQALTLPFMATVYEHFYRNDRSETSWWQKLSRHGWLWLLAGGYSLFRLRLFGALAPVIQRADLSGYHVVLSAIALVGQYLGKLLWPAQLCAFYVFHPSTSLLDPRVTAGLGALLLYGVLFVSLWRRARPVSFGLVWILATLAPVLNARWMAGNVFTERYLYLPSVGFCWVAGWAGVRLWAIASRLGLLWRRAAAVALSTLMVLSLIRIVTRNRDWQNDLVLFTRTLAVQPDAWQIHNNLGVTYWTKGDVKAAEREWREALKLKPNSQILFSNLGLARLKEKQYADAVKLFQRAIELDPKFTPPHLHLGEAYLALDLPNLAETQFRAAVGLSPLNAEARNQLGQLYLKQGRLEEAEEQFLHSVESEPKASAYDGLGDVYLSCGAREQAERAYSKALALERFDSHAHFKLAELYAKAGRKAEAVREYQAGLTTDPANAEAQEAIRKLSSQTPDAER